VLCPFAAAGEIGILIISAIISNYINENIRNLN
jgi:hypothetical protein